MAYWLFLTDLLAQRLNFHFKKSLLLGLLFFHISCSGSNPVSDLLGSISSKVASSKVAQKVVKRAIRQCGSSVEVVGPVYWDSLLMRNFRGRSMHTFFFSFFM